MYAYYRSMPAPKGALKMCVSFWRQTIVTILLFRCVRGRHCGESGRSMLCVLYRMCSLKNVFTDSQLLQSYFSGSRR